MQQTDFFSNPENELNNDTLQDLSKLNAKEKTEFYNFFQPFLLDL